MAENATIYASGPTKITVGSAADTILGYTNDEEAPRIDFTDNVRIVTSQDTGDAPAELIHRGRVAVITGAMVKWDSARKDDLEAAPYTTGQAATGNVSGGTIGSLYVAGNHTFQLGVIPTTADKTSYTFGRAIVQPEGGFSIEQFGNSELILRFAFFAFPDASGNLYAKATTT